jgi:hypothetical protein
LDSNRSVIASPSSFRAWRLTSSRGLCGTNSKKADIEVAEIAKEG